MAWNPPVSFNPRYHYSAQLASRRVLLKSVITSAPTPSTFSSRGALCKCARETAALLCLYQGRRAQIYKLDPVEREKRCDVGGRRADREGAVRARGRRRRKKRREQKTVAGQEGSVRMWRFLSRLPALSDRLFPLVRLLPVCLSPRGVWRRPEGGRKGDACYQRRYILFYARFAAVDISMRQL